MTFHRLYILQKMPNCQNGVRSPHVQYPVEEASELGTARVTERGMEGKVALHSEHLPNKCRATFTNVQVRRIEKLI